MDFSDTIVAPITPPGKGAVAIVRLSGPAAHSIAMQICPSIGGEMRYAYYGPIRAKGQNLDDGICTLFDEGASFTGESIAEISCHGSPQIVATIVEESIQLGARFARPGEFTERAFLNGTMDLSQAESVREAVESVTAMQAKRSGLVRSGLLFDRITEIEEFLGKVIASIEAVVDFSDEVGDLDRSATLGTILDAIGRIENLLAGVPTSRLIRRGLRVALVGRPNVGKSSLMNALLGADRAIVTDIPGTTRDTIEETISVRGYPVVLTDTAGLRDTDDPVEALGVERSKAAIEAADVVLLVFEAPAGITPQDRELERAIGRDVFFLANKSDLETFEGDAISTSAVAAGGVDQLADWLASRFESSHEEPLANERHEPDLLAAVESCRHAMDSLSNETVPVDLACVDLYDALDRLGRITGRSAPDEVIQRVFADFCIGK